MDLSAQKTPADTIRFLNLNIQRRRPQLEPKEVPAPPAPRSPSPAPPVERLSPAEVFHQRFRVRNISTGEEIDIRDENDSTYVSRLARLLASRPDDLEDY